MKASRTAVVLGQDTSLLTSASCQRPRSQVEVQRRTITPLRAHEDERFAPPIGLRQSTHAAPCIFFLRCRKLWNWQISRWLGQSAFWHATEQYCVAWQPEQRFICFTAFLQ